MAAKCVECMHFIARNENKGEYLCKLKKILVDKTFECEDFEA